MERNLYRLLLTVLPVLCIYFDAYGLEKDAHVISSTDSEFHFTVSIDPAKLDRQVDSDSLIALCKIIQIGIPYNARAELALARGRLLSSIDPNHFGVSRLSKQSHPLARISDPIRVRGRSIVTVQIAPVVGDRVYREVEVKVVFIGGIRGGVPANDPRFDRIFRASLANFEQFRTWPVPARAAAKAIAAGVGPFSDISNWHKISVNRTGLYRITGAQLDAAGISLTDLASDDIHIYNGGGLPLEVSNETPRPEFTELAIIVEDGGDGIFGRDDYIIFYGESQNRWVYRIGEPVRFVNNPYADHNVYWLTVSDADPGRRMVEIDASSDASVDTTITTHTRWVHLEQDNMLRRFNDGKIVDYYTWYWSDEGSLAFYAATPGVSIDDTADIELVGMTLDTTGALDDIGYMDLYVNDIKGLDKQCNQFGCSYRTASLVDGSTSFDLDLWSNSSVAPYFDYMNLSYRSENLPSNDKLDLTLGAYTGRAEIEAINSFSAAPLVLDIRDPLGPSIMTGAVISGGLLIFYADLDASVFNRFYLSPVQEALTPPSIEPAATVDLYDNSQQADLIIVTSGDFISALDEYVAYRQSDGYTIRVVAVDDIMDNFAFGMYDPTAIRDFLKYAYENYPSPAPSAVLFAGDGSYDYLNRLEKNTPNFVPPYIHAYDQSSSDDIYVYFGEYGLLDSDTSYMGGDRGFDMLTARWPVKGASEMSVIVDKIKRYESSSNFGIWKNDVTLVADDEFGTFDNETFHTTQTEELEKNHLPAFFSRRKIYLWEYPFVNHRKPDVNDEIVGAINGGTLLINFVGHGNPDVWAHERVFTRAGDLPRLNNYDRLPLVFTASCAIGFFDDPAREGMAEELLSISTGGAIGVISATRLVYSSDNAAFNRKVFDVLLYSDSLSICEAVYAAKLQRQYSGMNPSPQKNDRNYLFFGGPYVRLGLPKLDVEFTDAPDSLMALDTVHVGGRVIDDQGAVVGADGTLFVNVYDSERQKTYRLVDINGTVTQEVDYSVTGPTIYRGSATINAGVFDFEFIAPLDIGYGGDGAKISVYAAFDNIDGAGIVDSISVSGSIAVLSDTVGPSIDISFTNTLNFTSGDIISNVEQMLIGLSDPSGINLAGGLGHGITLQIDDQSENVVNLSHVFEYHQDDFTSGRISYALESIEPGTHRFKIKAWDNANNSARLEFDARVLAEEKLAIRDLLNYPNPMNGSTRFSFYLTGQAEKLSLEIYTLSGKKIRSFHRYSLNPGFYDDIQWYGRDADGDRVGSEVYIYKATAFPANSGEKVVSLGKVVVVN